jgi:hypothetical protein
MLAFFIDGRRSLELDRALVGLILAGVVAIKRYEDSSQQDGFQNDLQTPHSENRVVAKNLRTSL